MILYQIISSYQLLCALVHKQKFHKDDKCVLLIPKWIIHKFPHYNKLKTDFEDVIVFDGNFKLKMPVYPKQNTKLCQKTLKANKYSIKNFTEIHSMGCHHSFGAYLEHEKIPFIFWEDASGLLSRTDVISEVDRKAVTKAKNKYCLEHGLYDGKSSCVVKRICNFKAQTPDFDFDNAEDFDVIKTYLSLSKQEQLKIRQFFTDIEDLDIPKNSVLLLTQHFTNLKTLTFEEHILIYQLVVDYFFSDKHLVVKVHPDDIMYYSKLFPKADVIRNKFPSEFLPSLFKNKPNTIATVSSTAINSLKSYFDNTFALGNRFEKDFKQIHKYFAVSKIYEKYFSDFERVVFGCDNQLIDCLFKANGQGKSKFYIIDDLSFEHDFSKEKVIKLLNSLEKNDVVIFINSQQDYCFYSINDKKIWNNITPLIIDKKQTREEDFYDEIKQEVVYVYSNNQNLTNQISNFYYSMNLESVGEIIEARVLLEDKRYVKVLEGLLKASENLLKELVCLDELKDKTELKSATEKIDIQNIKKIKFSNDKLSFENMSDDEKQIRILEGIINSVEQRMLYYIER